MKLKLTLLAAAVGLVAAQACQTAAPRVEVAQVPKAAAPAPASAAPAPRAAQEAAPKPTPAAAPAPAPEAPKASAPVASLEVEPPTREVEPPPPEPIGPKPRHGDQFRVLILGDSMAATDFGKALEARLDAHPKVRCDRRGKSATGLARPDFFDWMSEGKKRVKKHDPDLVVVVIGGNDGQDLLPKKKGAARRVFWHGKKWDAAYRARLEDFAALLLASDRHLVWLELPAMDHRSLEKKLERIRRIQKETVADLGARAGYLSTRGFFYSGDDLSRTVKVKGYKKPQTLRQEDGIHFTVPGSRYFANRVYPKVLEALGLEGDGK